MTYTTASNHDCANLEVISHPDPIVELISRINKIPGVIRTDTENVISIDITVNKLTERNRGRIIDLFSAFIVEQQDSNIIWHIIKEHKDASI